MKGVISRQVCVPCIAAIILVGAIGAALAEPRGRIRLNENAFAFAAQNIKDGRVIVDGKGAWNEHHPSADKENDFIRRHGFVEYAKWHLGIDDRFAENTKRRYKFPYGDFQNVHRCGLLAVKARARQHGYAEIENAAAELERALKSRPQIDTDFHRW